MLLFIWHELIKSKQLVTVLIPQTLPSDFMYWNSPLYCSLHSWYLCCHVILVLVHQPLLCLYSIISEHEFVSHHNPEFPWSCALQMSVWSFNERAILVPLLRLILLHLHIILLLVAKHQRSTHSPMSSIEQ